MHTRYLPFFIAAALTSVSYAASFNLSGNSSSAQTLTAGETGNVQTGVILGISGSTTAINLSGTNDTTTLTNSGTIRQTGTGRTIRSNASGTPNFVITNNTTGVISAADADVIRGDVSGSSWNITNSGVIQSFNASAAGNQAIDLDAVTSGVVTITNNIGGQILATHADAIRAGANATIINHGLISATPDSSGSNSDGIDTQAKSGNTITNSGTISGRAGITGGDNLTTFRLTVNNLSGGLVVGVNGSAVNTDGALTTDNIVTVNNAAGATFRGEVSATTVNGDGDGIDIDGIGIIDNSGDILGFGAKGTSGGAEGISIGGGSVINRAGGRIIGSTLTSDAPNGDANYEGHGILVDNSDGGNALAATTITNEGLIQGRSGYAIKMIGNFSDTITNQAGGIIRGTNLNTASAAVQTGDGDDVINNAGSIIHDLGNSQIAIAAEAGNDTINIIGGAAVVTGGIDGGSGTNVLNFNLGSATNTFTHSAAISNFSEVNVNSGKTILNGASDYTGTTTIGGGSVAARLERNDTHTAAGNYTVEQNGTLAGNGNIILNTSTSILTVNSGGHLGAGNDVTTGRLTLTQGNIALNGTADFRLDGPNAGIAGGYDQIVIVDGNLDLSALSILNLTANYVAAEGTMFTLFDLQNDAATVTGTFAGLAEGAEFAVNNGQSFKISYIGGTGNDVVITAVPEPSAVTLFGILATLGAFRRRRSKA